MVGCEWHYALVAVQARNDDVDMCVRACVCVCVCSIDAVYIVQDFLHQKHPTDALAFIRASRYVYSLYTVFQPCELRGLHTFNAAVYTHTNSSHVSIAIIRICE